MQPTRVVRATEPIHLPTAFGSFQAIGYLDEPTGAEHVVLVHGPIDPKRPTLVRVHSECLTGDVLGSQRCDCGEQLHEAMRMIDQRGGVLVYMRQQEGRGIGLLNKLRAYKLQEDGLDTVEANLHLGFPPDMRDFSPAAEILGDVGLRRIRLMTNNPDKAQRIFETEPARRYGLDMVEIVPLQIDPNQHNERYLETKRDKMGHVLPFREVSRR
jgi:3,4-dihydroxy 2-butanone 4-phosphate synthase/GTP cyclohydrolase II